MPEQLFQKRNVAYKVRISDILKGIFAKDDSSAGYVKLGNLNVLRVNFIANLVYKSWQGNSGNAVVDDGTGKISLRVFENTDIFSKVDIGDFVMVIGKVREFNNERYVVPEIVKKIDNMEWANVRKLELKDAAFENAESKNDLNSVVEFPAGDSNDIYRLIRDLDKGDGVDFMDVLSSSKNKDAESIVNKLLENGDIFEVRPGRLKILE